MSVGPLDWLDRPVSRRITMRRSTALLTVAFIGLGAVFVQTRPDPAEDPPDVVVVVPTTTAPTGR
jgi:hypothetical protein